MLKLALQLSCRVEQLQTAFNEKVGPLLDETRADHGYAVNYQPASETDGVVRLHLHVVNQRNWGSFSADIQSASEDSFTLRTPGHTAHVPAALLPQALSVVKHGILALRPNA